jgi:ferredoxin--NADP+ reductase
MSKSKMELTEVKLTRKTEIAPGVFVISYQRNFSFIPGQVVALAVTRDEKPRMYSIASGNNESEISIIFNIKPGGELTPKLAGLMPGDSLFTTGPMGNFFGTDEPAFWIASGTGIAPFVSMWRSGLKNGKTLIHGGRYLNSFYFENDFKNELGEKYIRCCTRENAENVFFGRITKWLTEQNALPTNRKYYLCGSAEMVVEVRDILIEKGIKYDQIVAEIYF